MEPLVIACGGCGAAIRIRHPEIARRRVCPRCHTVLTRDQTPGPIECQSGPPPADSPREGRSAQTAAEGIGSWRRRPFRGRILIRPGVLLIASLLLGAGAMLEAVAAVSQSTAKGARPEWPRARPDLAAINSTPAALSSCPKLAVQPGTTEQDQVKPTEAASTPVPCHPYASPRESMAQPACSSGQDKKQAFEPRLAATSAVVSSESVTKAPNGDADQVAQPPGAVPLQVELTAAPADALADTPANLPRFKVRDELGQPTVARLHGQHEGTTALILPDGQLGIPNMLVPTNEPFKPFSAEELLERLQKGPLGDFKVHQTAHYLIFYQSSRAFAEASGRWLEDLYRRLLDAFRKHDMAVHDSEFPLVAVIYQTERDFRASKRVDPEVQAVYEIYTNRICFYEASEHDENAPSSRPCANLRRSFTKERIKFSRTSGSTLA